ncbi:MAG: DUF2231 domain-containing protein [Candidatus Marinimicrobia bacterium]|jgi:uncharacterized membrane protein|nr:DUF2231 domain-containing protein [Candidatus Neomarinimicrobiota bacterium]MBT3676686.1 DUF2231 domain-containing protein [Candidatus Neomarinimicrobiota bacterium]MBT3762644.1 DUF2231 domain-containing protein [Candidatus Neomarinimicrobiota bacterium]MBT4068961.1 DUF2231 domain-containing protein [Candidatus Neomarinimicrobiota bacterium]MBT4270699.1 DUF2231 domain-containing protein [Candidatus Neomarinimicrobiota bacterium]
MNIPLHPAIVHFPIALLYGALILHSIHLWRPNWICRVVGMWLLGLAAAFSIFAAITGEREATKAGQVGYSTEIIELMNRHELMGNIVTWGSIILCLGWVYLFFKNMEDRRIDILALAFLILMVIIVSFTSYLGGQLVWVHGVGTP